ncbi:MAG: type I methionyl aminopeptidase [Candidatus Fraserbacteria bacterium RBG_16_55_9]|uniref:Methionine aminopeptidase n=1 Tax=Fraserbacteria sp. (strain RBG_16_55_9) TaxID=1817864 RepID=A0A1F5UQI2_FRAXR|nr:MAG: type I methionyl aminopeptidase [Candidatus Fraserbacteria bacterium RBG_16_55_9]
MIQLKTESEIEILRENAHILNEILRELIRASRPGASTGELNDLSERLMLDAGVESAFKGYRGYPASICTSINEEIVHGIPRDDRVLGDGDVLSIDIGIERHGLYADKADTVIVGQPLEGTLELIGVAREALRRGIAQARSGNRVGDISHAIGSYAQSRGYRVVKQFVGHGIGRAMHEEPQVPNYGSPGRGAKLVEGMVLAIEPMVWKAGDEKQEWVAEDGWTVMTPDRWPSAHVEEMVLITEDGPDVLTDMGACS